MKQNLQTILKNRLTGAKRIAVLGVGSELRADDVAGVLVIDNLNKICKRTGKCTKKVKEEKNKQLSLFEANIPRSICDIWKFKNKVELGIFAGLTAPENLTGEIKKFNPTHLIIVDSVDIKQKPGTILILKPEEIGGATFSTHMLPLKIMLDYLSKFFKCEIIIVGIQPKNLEFGKKPSAKVIESAESIATAIKDAVA